MAKARNWTEKEIEYLMDSWGAVSMVTIAKNLGRSVEAVKLKAGRLGLGRFLDAGEYVTLNRLMSVMRGMSKSNNGYSYTIRQWIDKGLPVKRKKVNNCSFRVVYLRDWWDWAEENSTLIDFSKMEPLALGEEPAWVKEQRKADIEKRIQFKTSPWTKAEDKLLIDLLNSYRYTYRELSIRLKRTEGAIKRRVLDLGIKARPLKMPNHTPWTEAETQKLIELYRKGYTPPTMANYIARSSQAISGKIERLIKEGRLAPRSEFRVSC